MEDCIPRTGKLRRFFSLFFLLLFFIFFKVFKGGIFPSVSAVSWILNCANKDFLSDDDDEDDDDLDF